MWPKIAKNSLGPRTAGVCDPPASASQQGDFRRVPIDLLLVLSGPEVQTSSHVPQGSLKVSVVMEITFALAPLTSPVLRSQAYSIRLEFLKKKLVKIVYANDRLPSCVPRVCLVPREVRTVCQILELEFWMVVSHHVWVLGNQTPIWAGATDAPNFSSSPEVLHRSPFFAKFRKILNR